MKGRPPFEKFYPYLLFIFLGYCIADVGLLYARQFMIPDHAPTVKEATPFMNEQQPKGAYNGIISRNIFNPDGTIPDALSAKADGNQQKGEEIPVPSNLPLNLIGTIVHSKPEKSIANIELRGKNQVIAFTPNRDIDKIATLIKVERNKAIIRNGNNGRLEFIQTKEMSKLSFQSSKPMAGGPTGPVDVKQVAPNKFEIKGSDLDRQLADVSSLLMQASSIPKKGPNGEIRCYTILGIQPGGVFAQLGVTNGDCIKSVNGEAIDSPAKAIELFNALKTSSNLRLGFERDGRDNENEYNIRR